MNTHGGARPGAGRKPGSRNKATLRLVAEAEASGQLPLDYLLEVMRDESNDTKLRILAAKLAAPYVHSKLSSIEVSADIKAMTHEEWLESLH